MNEIILKKLKDIEDKENIKIIFAVESGSRAWGFASADSDYDVRFIYVRTLSDYLSLFPLKDTIDYQCDKIFDIQGWDLSKALKLLYKSNPTLYEWNNSPIIYVNTNEYQSLEQAFDYYYQTSKALHHYYHMSIQSYQTRPYTIKKCLYTLRTLLCCLWIIEKQTIPPIEFNKLIHLLPNHVKPHVNTLLDIKKSHNEKAICPQLKILDEYIQTQFIYIQSHLTKDINKREFDLLNKTFIRIINQSSIISIDNSCSSND